MTPHIKSNRKYRTGVAPYMWFVYAIWLGQRKTYTRYLVIDQEYKMYYN